MKHLVINYKTIKPKVLLSQERKGQFSNTDTSIFKAHEEAICLFLSFLNFMKEGYYLSTTILFAFSTKVFCTNVSDGFYYVVPGIRNLGTKLRRPTKEKMNQ